MNYLTVNKESQQKRGVFENRMDSGIGEIERNSAVANSG